MFSTSSIIDNLNQDEGLEFGRLCRRLKLSKKSDKDKLEIALKALEELEIINKNEKNEYYNVKESDHITAKIRCSSKGFCFAVRENGKEDIYIRENLLNYSWNGDKVLVRIIKEGYRKRSPEGIVDCILERSNQILLAKVEIINNQTYGIPIDDRILSKIKLPKEDEKYIYKQDYKNIVKVQIDIFPIGQKEGTGHVIEELKLNDSEQLDPEFVLSKSNIKNLKINNEPKIKEITKTERIDLSGKKTYLFKSWNSSNSPLLPLVHVEENKGSFELWLHTNAISERLDLSNKKSLEILFDKFESFPLLNDWDNYLSESINNISRFNLGETNEAISICMKLNSDYEIVNWSFHLTFVKCSLMVENKHLQALTTRKGKTRITSRVLKPIKEYVEDLDKIVEISRAFRKKQIFNGKIEVYKQKNHIESLEELLIHNPADYSKEYFEPLNADDCQTYISPILYEADLIWFKHSSKYGLKNAAYVSQNLDYLNMNEIIKYSELVNSNLELNADGNLTFKQLAELCDDDNKKRILHKLFINTLRDNEITLISHESLNDDSRKTYISPWTTPSYDFANLMNQYNIVNMIKNGKSINKNTNKNINIMLKDSWEEVNWDIYSASVLRNLDLLFNNFVVDKMNDYKNKIRQYKDNMINIKQVRKAEKLLNESYNGFIISVQSYGFFVEIPELNVEGLVHVSTLNNDWYEYRSRQNLLIGRKSKKSYKIGDEVKIKIIKVDILKYQIDLELI